MSPEQARGEVLDARTDIFSFGIVLYEMATGRHPFPGRTDAVIFDAILHGAPDAPSVSTPPAPPELEHIIGKCLEKDRTLRYQGAAELLADLRRLRRDTSAHGLVAATGSLGAADSALQRGPRDPTAQTRRPGGRRGAVAAGIAAAVLVGVPFFVLFPSRRSPGPHRPRLRRPRRLREHHRRGRVRRHAPPGPGRAARAVALPAHPFRPAHAEGPRPHGPRGRTRGSRGRWPGRSASGRGPRRC